MRPRALHPWSLTPKRAVAVQRRLAERVELSGLGRARTVAGADVSYDRGDDVMHAAILVLDARTLEVLDVGQAVRRVRFPYVPGLLSFREAPALIAAARRLALAPDVLIVDGQGLAHPRGLGLACHLGLVLDCPTVGCAKTRLVGEHGPVGPRKGDAAPLRFEGRTVGTVLRTREGVKPVYVSPGHRVSVRRAAGVVLRATTRYRLPEPTRQAHLWVNRMRRGEV